MIDGQGIPKDPQQLWMSESSKMPWIVFDLGRQRTVTELRIWNVFGSDTISKRGWKTF